MTDTSRPGWVAAPPGLFFSFHRRQYLITGAIWRSGRIVVEYELPGVPNGKFANSSEDILSAFQAGTVEWVNE